MREQPLGICYALGAALNRFARRLPLARKPKSSFSKHPNQFSLFDTSDKQIERPAAPEPPLPPSPTHSFRADTHDQPSVLRRAVQSGLIATGDVIKEGARDAAVSGVKWGIGAVLAGTGIGGYLLLSPTAEQPAPQPPKQIESKPTPPQAAAVVTGSIQPKAVVSPQVQVTRQRKKRKTVEKTTTTRIFILEDIVDWLKRDTPH